MSAYSLGVLVGVLAGVIFAIFLLKWMKKGREIRCRWDERQLLIRGNGFKYSFFTVIILLYLYSMFGNEIHGFPMDYQATGIFIIFFGVMVDIVYCIWKGAYFALNENKKRVMAAFVVLGLINLLVGIRNLVNGDSFTDGVLNIRSANLFCGVLFVVIFATMLIRMLISEKDDEEESFGQ